MLRYKMLYLCDLLDVGGADAAVDFNVQVGKEAPEARNLLHHVTHELLTTEALWRESTHENVKCKI